MLELIRKTIITKETYKFVAGKPFNPNFDGNLLAWYDGDTLSTDPVNTWSDKSGNGNTLTLFNNPSIIDPAINGHAALRFNGINQEARNVASPALNQPLTIYIVLKQISWTNVDYIYCGMSGNNILLVQITASPNVLIQSGAGGINSNPDLSLNTYGIFTSVYNGANSELRTNDSVAVSGNIGANNATGFRLANSSGGGNYSEIEVAYIIIRSNSDNTSIQNNIINTLKSRFAI